MVFGVGESVGTAYVRIIADGSGLDKSIRDQFDDVDMQSIGKKQGNEYVDGFNDAWKDHSNQAKIGRTLEQALQRGTGRFDALGQFAGSDLIEGLRDKLQAQFGNEIGGVMHDEFQEALDSQTLDYAQLQATLEDGLGPVVARATKKVSNQQKAALEKMLADQQKFLDAEAEAWEDAVNERAALLRRDAVNAATAVQARVKAEEEYTKFWESELDKRDKAASDNNEVDHRLHLARLKRIKEEGSAIDKFSREADAFGDSLGRMFGAGGRNDFINIFGRFIGFIPRALSGFAKLGQSAQQFGQQFMEGFGSLEEGASFFTKFSAGVSKVGPALTAAVGGAAVAMAALEVASSTLSLTLGGLTAVIGTLGSGLIGGVTLLAASLVPLVAGIGSVIVAWQSLDEAAQRTFKNSIEPLTDAFAGLGDIAALNIFGGLGDKLNELVPFMQTLGVVTDTVTKAVRDQIDSWVDLATSGAFLGFFNTLTQDLPGQIASLNRVIQNLFVSFTGLFQGISPVLSEFLDGLDKVTAKFAEWSNSAAGQSQITSFFDSALDSVKVLGRTLIEAGKLLGNFFRLGAEGGGNELFADLASTFSDWNAALMANQDQVKAWVADGADFLRVIGELVVGIGKLIAALDTPLLRTVITGTIASIATSFQILAFVIEKVRDAIMNLHPFFVALQGVAKGVGGALSFLGDKFGITEDKADKAGEAIKFSKEELKRSNAVMASAGRRYQAYTEAVARATEKQREMRKTARAQAAQFINLGDAAKKAKDNLATFTRLMNRQAQQLQNYTTNLQKAGENGVRKGLLADLRELGPAGAKIVSQLATATDTQVEKANRAWKRGEDAIDRYARKQVPDKEILVNNDKALQAVRDTENALVGIPDVTTVYVDVVTRGGGSAGRAPAQAAGGINWGPTWSLTGEAGPEAVVPLRRPLATVDPSVRALSAFAQGKQMPSQGPQRVFNNTFNIQTPTSNPRAVAVETINRLATVGGF